MRKFKGILVKIRINISQNPKKIWDRNAGNLRKLKELFWKKSEINLNEFNGNFRKVYKISFTLWKWLNFQIHKKNLKPAHSKQSGYLNMRGLTESCPSKSMDQNSGCDILSSHLSTNDSCRFQREWKLPHSEHIHSSGKWLSYASLVRIGKW